MNCRVEGWKSFRVEVDCDISLLMEGGGGRIRLPEDGGQKRWVARDLLPTTQWGFDTEVVLIVIVR